MVCSRIGASDDLVLEVDSPVELTENHREGPQEAVERSVVHHTLRYWPQITVNIESPAAVQV